MQFIFDNPFFIFIIIGIITSLIKKVKGSNQTQSNQEKRPDWKKMINFPQTINESQREITRPQNVQPNEGKLAKEYYEYKKAYQLEKEKVTFTQSIPRNASVTKNAEIAKKEAKLVYEETSNLSPSRDHLIDAVIWSEILGPPRALKPHSTRRGTVRK